MNKRKVVAGASILTLTGMLVGCGSAGTQNTSAANNNSAASNTSATNSTSSSSSKINLANASGTIVWSSGPITHSGMRKKLVSMFEKKYPKIHVKMVTAPPSTNTDRAQYSSEIGGGSPTPDVYLGDVIWPAQFGNAQLALPLNKYLPSSFFKRFAPGLVKGATYKKNIYAAPFFVDAGFLYYRKDLLKKAGISGPPKTWSQLKKDSQELQKKGLVKYGFVWQGNSYEGLTCDFMEYFSDAGGTVFKNGKPNIDSSQATKAVSFMKSLITSGVSPQATDTFEEPQTMNVFNNGNAAFLRNWDYAWSDSQNKKQSKVVGKVGVTVLPTFKGSSKHYSTIGGWDFYINPHSKHIAADLQFIKFMTGQEAQTVMATNYSEIPTNAVVQDNPKVKKVNPVLSIISKVNLVSRPDNTPKYAAISKAIYSNVNNALSGGISVDAALKQAQAQMKSALGGGL